MSVPQVQITARDYYVLTKGIPLDAAIALVSVFYYESKLNPGSQGYQTTETPGVLNPHGAYGIMSLNGPRQKDLLDFATVHNLPVNVLETQLDFALTDMANKYPNCWAAIRSAASYKGIITPLVDEYENPKNKAAEIAGALAIAASLAALPPPKPAVPAFTPQVPATIPPSAPPAVLPQISATTAGRRAAEQNHIASMINALTVEKAAVVKEYDEEIAVFVEMAASFGKLNPAPTAPSLPAPPAIPAAPAATQEGNTMTILPIIRSIATNWVTSALGTFAGSPALIDIINTIGTATGPNWKADIGPLVQMGLGLAAKDGWITGGAVPATPEAKTRTGA